MFAYLINVTLTDTGKKVNDFIVMNMEDPLYADIIKRYNEIKTGYATREAATDACLEHVSSYVLIS